MNIKILISMYIITLVDCESNVFDVKRYKQNTSNNSTGFEPYRPVNYFINKNSLCFFSYCWNRGGTCIGAYNCCQCECKDGKTFVSEIHGCKDGTDIVSYTREQGKACEFVTGKLRFSYVPLFVDFQKAKMVELTLSYDYNYDLNNINSTCRAGKVYAYDLHGHKLLYHQNECEELIVLRSYKGKHYLQFFPETPRSVCSFTMESASVIQKCFKLILRSNTNQNLDKDFHHKSYCQVLPSSGVKWQSQTASHWNSFKGQLLSVDIGCDSNLKKFNSCFLFQVEGQYVQENAHGIPPTPSKQKCPNTPAYTWMHATAITKPATTFRETSNLLPIVAVTLGPAGSSKNTIGIAAGVVTAVIIVIIAVVALVIIAKRKQNASKDTSQNLIQQPIRQPVAPNVYHDYNAKNTAGNVGGRLNIGDENVPLQCQVYDSIDDKEAIYTPVDDNRCIYTPVDEEHYESPDKFTDEKKWKRLSSDMAKRPLPDKPKESENPYYCGTEEVMLLPLRPQQNELVDSNQQNKPVDSNQYDTDIYESVLTV